jgi:hypothetical protein
MYRFTYLITALLLSFLIQVSFASVVIDGTRDRNIALEPQRELFSYTADIIDAKYVINTSLISWMLVEIKSRSPPSLINQMQETGGAQKT